MLRPNSFWSTAIRLISEIYSSQTTNGSSPAVVCHPSKAAVPGAQINGLPGCLRLFPEASILLMVVLVFASGNAWAQTTGTLLGVVSDPKGAVIPSATVRVTNTDTGFITSVVSSSEGSYLLPFLPIGHYSISVEAGGFKSFKQSGVMVPVAQNIRVDAKLEVGQVAQTVTVAGNAVNIDTTDATIGETVDRARLESLPLDGRNALGLMETLPGVTTSNAPTTVTWMRNGPSFSISGSRTNQANLMLDGTTLTDAISDTSQNLPTVDALQEFRVLTDSYSAEYGRASGGVVLAVTKSGGNKFHGSAWEFLRNDAFDAANAFTPAGTRKPMLRQDQFGGDMGGPVMLPKYSGKDRSFFFVSYEGLRIHQDELTVAYPPIAAVRSGDISTLQGNLNPATGRPLPIIDPNTGLPFPNNQIPSGELDAFAQNTLKLYAPLPNAPNNALDLTQPTPSTGNQVVVKLDQTIGNKDRLWGRYFWIKDIGLAPQAFPAFQDPLTGRFMSYAVNETHTFSSTLLNEFQVSYSRPQGSYGPERLGQSAQSLGSNANEQAPYPQVPEVSVNGNFSFGTDWDTDEPSYFRQFDDKLSWIKGKHSFRVGYMIMYATNSDLAHPPITFTFDGSFSNNPVVDFLVGRPVNLSVITTIIDDGTMKQYQPFFQDDYKVTSRLTLNYGLRYDLDTPWTEKRGNAATYIAGEQSKVFPTAPPGLVVPGDPGVPPGLYRTFKTGLAPRIGLAWDITGTGQTSVRAGWGIYHNTVNEEVEAAPSDNEPFLLIFNFVPFNTANPYQGTSGDPLPYNPSHPSFGPFPGMNLQSVNPNFRYPDVQQFNLNIQHRFGNDIFLETAYVGSVSHHLYEVHDINPALYGPGATEANAQSRRPILPQYYGEMGYLDDDVNANYNALQVDAQKRFGHGYAVQGTYVWSKSIDERSQPLIGGQAAQSPYNWLKGERALSDFNMAQIFGINGLWDLPSLHGNGIVKSVLGDWRLSGIFRYNTGLPATLLSGSDSALIGTTEDTPYERPSYSGAANPNLSTSRSRKELEAEYFNPAAFTLPSPGQFGNVPRNSIITPGNLQNDVSLEKAFPFLGEKGKFTFKAEFFNVINWTNLQLGWLGAGQNASPTATNNITLNSTAFGTITSAGPARIGQFALRYDF